MEDIIETVASGVGALPPSQEYTDDEMQQQTTDFLLYLIDQMKDVSEVQKAKMRANIIERALDAGRMVEEVLKPKKVSEGASPQDLILLLVLIFLIVGSLGKKSCVWVWHNILSVHVKVHVFTSAEKLF